MTGLLDNEQPHQHQGVDFIDSTDNPIINEKGQAIELPIDLVN